MFAGHRILAVSVCVVLFPFISDALGDSGDHLWNLRENGDDRFHSNEAWLRPWRSSVDDGYGRWVGNYSYDVPWGGLSPIGGSDGSFSLSRDRDHQFHAWTYVYVTAAKSVSLSGGGDCVPRAFLNHAFDSPREFTANFSLISGWNRIDVTGYNQNSGYGFSVGALAGQVDYMNREIVDLTPTANFTWQPSLGWATTTPFSFTDTSANSPDNWQWDVDNDGLTDYVTQHVAGHLYAAPDGGSATYSARLSVSHLGNPDVELKSDIITVFGKPVAEYQWSASGLTVSLSNASIEPGKAELDAYSYAWDTDHDGQYDDGSLPDLDYTFSQPGTYDVSLLVTNGAGNNVVSHLVTVPEPAAMCSMMGGALILGGAVVIRRVRSGRRL